MSTLCKLSSIQEPLAKCIWSCRDKKHVLAYNMCLASITLEWLNEVAVTNTRSLRRALQTAAELNCPA
eukprot:2155434-Pleurochrysis_carterae.AAC.3